jgi:hypothetical protein
MNGLPLALTGFFMATRLFAADASTILETPISDFHAGVEVWGGLCGNLKILCGSMAAEGEIIAKRKEIDSKLGSENIQDTAQRVNRYNELKIKTRLGSGKVSDALRKIVEDDPHYEWALDNGVVNILPKKGYRHLENGADPLETRIKSVDISSVTSSNAAIMILQASGLRVGGREKSGPREHCATVSLQLKDLTLREALNALVKADGMASWGLEYSEYKNYVVDVYCWRRGPSLWREEDRKR